MEASAPGMRLVRGLCSGMHDVLIQRSSLVGFELSMLDFDVDVVAVCVIFTSSDCTVVVVELEDMVTITLFEPFCFTVSPASGRFDGAKSDGTNTTIDQIK